MPRRASTGGPPHRRATSVRIRRYGVALVGVARERDAPEEQDAGGASEEGADADGPEAAEAAEPAAKRARVVAADGGRKAAAEDAAEAAAETPFEDAVADGAGSDDDDDDEGSGEDASADDAAVAWQLLDQARCIFQGAGDAAGAARCAEQLAGLDVDEGRWADAVVEFSACVDWYESATGLGLEDRARHASCVAGLGAAYAEHARAAPGADLAIEDEHGEPVPVAAAAEVPARARSYAARAERLTDTLLTGLAGAGGERSAARKRQLCALAVEVQHAKDLAAGLAERFAEGGAEAEVRAEE